MSQHHEVIVFIDRREAKVFHVSPNEEGKLVFTHTSAQRQHHRADQEDATKHAVDDEFMKDIVSSLDLAGSTLICGPGNSKYELQGYMQEHAPKLAERVAGVESWDDPKFSSILGMGREFFQSRSERHIIKPLPNSRHFDVPVKS